MPHNAGMTISTVFDSLRYPGKPHTALVLMGGGARTAYQAGALRAIAAMQALQDNAAHTFPFPILVGTSAGALNASFLAARAAQGLAAFESLAQFWLTLRSHDVYALEVARWTTPLVGRSKIVAALSLGRQARSHGAVLSNMPLVNTLHRAIALSQVDDALLGNHLHALAVTASSYSTGVHWTFCHTLDDTHRQVWNRPGRRSEFQPITIEHLIASSAIPLIFPSTALWVDGRREFFGDGSMRQISPLSPALHLGAAKVLAIGVGQPQRSGFAGGANKLQPSLGSILGHAMASVFHDTLLADVQQAQRVNATLRELPREIRAVMPYRSVEVMALQPSESLDDYAQAFANELPVTTRKALTGLGALRGGGAALASYLLFEPGFVKALMDLGERDAYARKAELLAFLAHTGDASV